MTEEVRLIIMIAAIFFGTVAASCHVLSAFLEKCARILAVVNVVSHILLFACIFILGCEMSILVLVMMASVAVRSLSYYIKSGRDRL